MFCLNWQAMNCWTGLCCLAIAANNSGISTNWLSFCVISLPSWHLHSPAPLPGTSNTLLLLGYSPGAFSTVSIYSSYFFLLEELSSTKPILTSATIRSCLISPLLIFSSPTQENIFVYCQVSKCVILFSYAIPP